MDFTSLQSDLSQFAAERDWEQFHSVRNLLLALVGEIGELAEILQWVDDADIDKFLCEGGRDRVEEELADIILYTVRLAQQAGVDLDAAVTTKLQKNAIRYPMEKARGNSKKYTELS